MAWKRTEVHGWLTAEGGDTAVCKGGLLKYPRALGPGVYLLPNYDNTFDYAADGVPELARKDPLHSWFSGEKEQAVLIEAAAAFKKAYEALPEDYRSKHPEDYFLEPRHLYEPDGSIKTLRTMIERTDPVKEAYRKLLHTLRADVRQRLCAAAHAALGPHDPGLPAAARAHLVEVATKWADGAEKILYEDGFRKPKPLGQTETELVRFHDCRFLRQAVLLAGAVLKLTTFLESTLRVAWPVVVCSETVDMLLQVFTTSVRDDPMLVRVARETIGGETGLIPTWVSYYTGALRTVEPSMATAHVGNRFFSNAAFEARIVTIMIAIEPAWKEKAWRTQWRDATSARPSYANGNETPSVSNRLKARPERIQLPVSNTTLSIIEAPKASNPRFPPHMGVESMAIQWTSTADPVFRTPFKVRFLPDRDTAPPVASYVRGAACEFVTLWKRLECPGSRRSSASRILKNLPRLRQSLEEAMGLPLTPALHAALGPYHPSARIAQLDQYELCKGRPLVHNGPDLVSWTKRTVSGTMRFFESQFKEMGSVESFITVVAAMEIATTALVHIFETMIRLEWPYDNGMNAAKLYIRDFPINVETLDKVCYWPSDHRRLKPEATRGVEMIARGIRMTLVIALREFEIAFEPTGWLDFLPELESNPFSSGWPDEYKPDFTALKDKGWRCSNTDYYGVLLAKAAHNATHVFMPMDVLSESHRRSVIDAQFTLEQRLLTKGSNGLALSLLRFDGLWVDYPHYVGFCLTDWCAKVLIQRKTAGTREFMPSWCVDVMHYAEKALNPGIVSEEQLEENWLAGNGVCGGVPHYLAAIFGYVTQQSRESYSGSALSILRALNASEKTWRLVQQRAGTICTDSNDDVNDVQTDLGDAVACLSIDRHGVHMLPLVVFHDESNPQKNYTQCRVFLDDLDRLFNTSSEAEPIRSLLALYRDWDAIWRANVWNGEPHTWGFGYNSLVAKVLPTLWALARQYARRETFVTDPALAEWNEDPEYPFATDLGKDADLNEAERRGAFGGAVPPNKEAMHRRRRVLHAWYFIHMVKRAWARETISVQASVAELKAQYVAEQQNIAKAGVTKALATTELMMKEATTARRTNLDENHAHEDVAGRMGKRSRCAFALRRWRQSAAAAKRAQAFYVGLARFMDTYVPSCEYVFAEQIWRKTL